MLRQVLPRGWVEWSWVVACGAAAVVVALVLHARLGWGPGGYQVIHLGVYAAFARCIAQGRKRVLAEALTTTTGDRR